MSRSRTRIVRSTGRSKLALSPRSAAMTTTFRLKLLTCCVGAALAQTAAVTVQADSAVGVDTMLGNALNPTTLNRIDVLDPEGLDVKLHSRTPTGQLYDWDPLPKEQSTTSSGWVYSGSIEVGGIVVSGDEDNAWFRKYKDLDTGLYLNNFEFQAHNPDSAGYLEALGGGLGYDDQFYGLEFGRYNDWRGKVFYNETPHVFTSRYRSLWTDTDSGYLYLKDLPAGGDPSGDAATTRANIASELDQTGFSELGIVRQKGGLSLDKRLNDRWQFLATYSKENREGSRPFGVIFGGGGGGGDIEIPEPIDYDTHDLYAGLRYDDGVNNLNLGVTASLFRNNIDTFTFENPLTISVNNAVAGVPATAFTTGTFDLYPDNDYWNVKGEYARSMPEFWQARFTALASFSWLRQDDDLIAPTSNSLTGGSIGGIPTDDVWNTTAALSQQSADAAIDTMLFDVGLSLRPVDKLDVKGKIRYYETDNDTEYWACNPLTGQWGMLINDGSGADLESAYAAAGCDLAAARALGLTPSNPANPIRNIPFDYSQTNYVLGGDYRLTPGSTLNLTLEREEYDRNHREREETWENMVKLGYVNRGFDFGTLRLSADYGERRGDDYVTNPYQAFRAASLGEPDTSDGANVRTWINETTAMRKFDLADRNRLNLNGRLNLIATEATDVGLTLNYRDDEYPNSDIGRTDHDYRATGTIDVNFQPSDKLGLYGFYTYQQGHMEQTGVESNTTCIIGVDGVTEDNWETECAKLGGQIYDLVDIWNTESDDRYHVFGLGGRYDFGRFIVKLDYSFITGVTEYSYDYNASVLGGAEDPAQVGNGFSDLETTQHILDLNLLYPISKSLAIRGLYRYEYGKIDDWHYDGVEGNPAPTNNTVYLDSGPEDYHDHVVGLFVQLSF
ncbi:hypothetical protein CKO41_14635 [Thiococcus pfennigii]|nr:hypothetical protein [Thiococcus pfennigii]